MNTKSFLAFLLQIFSFFTIIIFINLPLYAESDLSVGSKRTFTDEYLSYSEITSSSYSASSTDSLDKETARIYSVTQKVKDEGRLIQRLDQAWRLQYPVGLTSETGDYVIVLENDEITPEGAFVNAVMCVTLPISNKVIVFKANKIPLTADGGLNGIAELALLQTEPVKLTKESRLLINGINASGIPRTRVQFDCQGFKSLIIDATLEFSDASFALEDTVTGKTIPGKLQANFVTTIENINNLIVSISLPPFQYKPLRGFGFEVKQATFDFSDLSNPIGAVFPKDYVGITTLMDLPQLWRGTYIREATIRLPSKLGSRNGGKKRTAISAENLIIDDYGFSGVFAASNLIPLDKGSIGGWAYSLDRIEVELLTGSLTKAGFQGKLNVPLMDSADYMNYTATIGFDGDFLIAASMPHDVKVPLFVATMQLDKSSMITIEDKDDEFDIKATLNGKINIDAPISSDKGFKASDLTFEQMIVSTKYPHFKPGIWSLGEIGVNNINGFSLLFSNIKGFDEGDDVGLQFTATVILSDGKYCAATTLKIIGTRYSITESGEKIKHKLRYKKIEFLDLYICVKDAPISLEGYLAIYKKDPVYGNGFAGMIKANIVGKIGINVRAAFGEVKSFKYWYVDAFANLSASPIPIFTGMALYGIGGGAYAHMSQVIPIGIPFSDSTANVKKSAIDYIPDKSVGFGFKATVAIGSSSPKSFNAMATFEIVFNSGGGIKEIKFYGDGVFMAEMDFAKPPKDPPVKASVYLGMDFNTNTLHGSFKVYVNAINGMLRGINPGNLAGEAVIHYDPVDWYIHIGKPSCRIGLEFNILGMSIKNGSYFMMGTQIEPMPPPPDNVLRLLGMPLPENREDAELQNAKGFAFGTSFSISTGNLQMAVFYAKFDMGMGFDVMFSDKGETYCAETGDKIGVNGWYAEGQLYAFVEGSIGIRVKVFRKTIKAEILSLGAATLLEAKLPNPFWVRGTVGGYYRILGGRVKGNCKFKFELGKQCTLITKAEEESAVEGLQIISEISPADGRTNVDVFSTPQVVFNYQINKPFSISDDGTGDLYKVKLDYFNVKANNTALPGSFSWNAEGDVLIFTPRDILPGTTDITLEAKVHFEQKVGSAWVTVLDEGIPITQIKSIEFETGEAPDYIPESNVIYNYPMFDMMNFYKNEYTQGFIQLSWGQEYLFNVTSDWVQYGKFTPVSGGTPLYVNFTYNAGAKKIEYGFPVDLKNGTVYKVELVNVPVSAKAAIDANITTSESTSSSDAGDMTIQSKATTSERLELKEDVLYTCYFRTSKYNSLNEKINSISFINTVTIPLSNSVFNLNSYISIDEPFDKYEIEGYNGVQPLILIEASRNAAWIRNFQESYIYDNYPLIPEARITRRNINDLGLIPVKAVSIDLYGSSFRLLSEDEKATGIASFNEYTYMNYKLSPITHSDWQEIVSILALKNDFVHPQKTKLLTNMYPSIIINANYPVIVNYSIPGITSKGSQGIINVTY
jgi:hypothetical protein